MPTSTPRAIVHCIAWLSLGALTGCGDALGSAPTTPLAPSAVRTPRADADADVDYLAVVPASYRSALDPLVALRTREGHQVRVRVVEDVYAERTGTASHEEALRAEIDSIASQHPSLHYVLLAGDPRGEGGAVPTFHQKIGDWVGAGAGDSYASDHPYALFPKHPLAVGRLPARSVIELERMVEKLTAYASAPSGAWGRRVLFFGGPANFGATLDLAIETFATSELDASVPHDFDLGVVFAQPSSPYAYRLDRLGAELSNEMSDGALLAVFAGHGSARSLDSVEYRKRRYPIARVGDFDEIHAAHGNPIFLAITCSAGAFDRPERLIAETAMLNPHGPIAAFAASAFSGGYPNVLFSEELLDSFLVERRPTIGDALLEAKKRLPDASSPLKLLFGSDGTGDEATSTEAVAEHLFIYNLFGDPATRPAYVAAAKLDLGGSTFAPGRSFDVKIEVPSDMTEVDVTLETERTELKEGIVDPAHLDALELGPAFDTMERNHALAVDKVIARARATLVAGGAKATLVAPATPGTYWVRAIATGEDGAAAGAAKLVVSQ